MANIRLIKGRIKSAKNISQITKAMELVAASKMKKAQAQAQAGKFYAEKIYEMVMRLAATVNTMDHPLLAVPKESTGKRLLILVSSNKGLCGGLNANLFRFLIKNMKAGVTYRYLTVGKKGATFAVHVDGQIVADFSDRMPFAHSVSAIIDCAVDMYTRGEVDGVDVAYNEFISALVQEPRLKTVLPVSLPDTVEKPRTGEMLIEPSAEAVFSALLPHYIENQLRDAILEAEASEQSARMIAMRNATDNAQSLMTELTLVYNKARQEKITYEISDIVTAQLAVS